MDFVTLLLTSWLINSWLMGDHEWIANSLAFNLGARGNDDEFEADLASRDSSFDVNVLIPLYGGREGTLLHLAARCNYKKAFECLLRHPRVNPNTTDSMGWSVAYSLLVGVGSISQETVEWTTCEQRWNVAFLHSLIMHPQTLLMGKSLPYSVLHQALRHCRHDVIPALIMSRRPFIPPKWRISVGHEVPLLAVYQARPLATYHRYARDLGIRGALAAEWLAYFVLLTDHFVISGDVNLGERTLDSRRILHIAMQLPLELQTVLARRCSSLNGDSILSRDLEPALSFLAEII